MYKLKIMRYPFYFFSILCLLVIGCKQTESKLHVQPKVNIYLPTNSANVVFHIKDNKVTSYEFQNEDGTPIKEELVYRKVNENGSETCYRCPDGVLDETKCTVIKCPEDPCKIIYCGPLKFQMNDMPSSTDTREQTQFTIVADGVKR